MLLKRTVFNSLVNLVNPVILWFLLSFLSGATKCLYSNQFAIHVPAGEAKANEIASKHGFTNVGQIGSLHNYFLFEHSNIRKRSIEIHTETHKLLEDEPHVVWFEQQIEKKRVKRDFPFFQGSGSAGPSPYFSTAHSFAPSYQTGFIDPLWKEQWYLNSGSKDGYDMNVEQAWQKGYTGKGVTVSILDDGIQTNHPDLLLNYDARASTDINDNDNDPTPQDNGDNKHGTRCAGEVAATAGNNICGVGIAYNASIGGVRMLDGTVNDAVEAKALGLNPDHIDIYSASWGPEDDGKTVDGPGPLARRAFIYGVTNGRRGLGSIFIWASGNGGRHVDSCNCDGYTNSIFTLSISSATQGGYKPWYLEECASTLATTYSSGTPTLDKSVATVDMDGRLRPDHICTVEHTGTSASAPLAAGMAALALEANPKLTWRDMQHLVVMTSRPVPLEKEEGWFINGVQRKFSHKFGYGLMDAAKMVDLALDWGGVPPQHICKSREMREDREIPGVHAGKVKVYMDVDGCAGTNSEIRFLEHVQCKISLTFFPRGNLRILLTSPMGTTSVLLFERPRDVSSSNFDDWPFLSVHFWGEHAHGRWTLEIINSGNRRINQPGILKKWQLILYGTDVNPVRLKSRSISQPSNYNGGFNQARQFLPPQNRQNSNSFPRYQSQDYLFPGASEIIDDVEKPQMVRSQCRNEYWIPDLFVCVNDCPDGYYADKDRKECLSCSPRCKSCYNSTSCTACDHNLVLFEDVCTTTCPSGYYEADSSCERCKVKGCISCAGHTGDECVKCKSGLVLKDNVCVNKCGSGYWQSPSNECVKCPSGCATCNESECTKCSLKYKLSSTKGSCIERNPACPSGLFLDDLTGKCDSCASNCGRCELKEKCVECQQNHFLHDGHCVANCDAGFYTAFNNKECVKCPKLCALCNSHSECIQCHTNAYMQGSECVPHCEDGFFNDVGVCSSCYTGCKTCLGASESECVSCNPGFTLTKEGTCVESNLVGKVAASYEGNQTSCHDGFWYNERINRCVPCHPTCFKCSGPKEYNCRKCAFPLRLDIGTSRCVRCCEKEGELDCCHCDDERHSHTSSNPLTKNYNGECHSVSRRVSGAKAFPSDGAPFKESISVGVLWLCVFIVAVSIVVIFQRRKRRDKSLFYLSGSSQFSNSRNKLTDESHSSIKYTPVNINDNTANSYRNRDLYESPLFEQDESMTSFDYEDDLSEQSEGVPLVLKT